MIWNPILKPSLASSNVNFHRIWTALANIRTISQGKNRKWEIHLINDTSISSPISFLNFGHTFDKNYVLNHFFNSYKTSLNSRDTYKESQNPSITKLYSVGFNHDAKPSLLFLWYCILKNQAICLAERTLKSQLNN